ncbi:hypothetical protein HFP51_11945 [Parasphingopyxis sp. CP4]|uniref:hypothetical protein n=1 Tax=Parasphingopyxis sp. CP4 TaxID=2724527 RepID=UPI0015A3026E|nr:hypothetical protein [Parasphingopyxis sp. CP4]QLC22830.1 hypothetical protein HFP51_11945 [Parasphingopyxis sp. CP4]
MRAPVRRPIANLIEGQSIQRSWTALNSENESGRIEPATKRGIRSGAPNLTGSVAAAIEEAGAQVGTSGTMVRSAVMPIAPAPSNRASLAIWAQWRAGIGTESLANAGELGGSQAGARLSYPIWHRGSAEVAIAARLSRPIERADGAEAAIGLAVQPSRSVPVTVSFDRRIAIEPGGRNAWSIGVAGGVYRKRVTAGLELDGYGQVGIVGAESRDLFIDGSASLSQSIAIGDRAAVSLGIGVWGGAQPGAARLDIGPEAGLRLSVDDIGVRLALGWRQRVAGMAAPGSGPAVTLGADF